MASLTIKNLHKPYGATKVLAGEDATLAFNMSKAVFFDPDSELRIR